MMPEQGSVRGSGRGHGRGAPGWKRAGYPMGGSKVHGKIGKHIREKGRGVQSKNIRGGRGLLPGRRSPHVGGHGYGKRMAMLLVCATNTPPLFPTRPPLP